jgi:hypothetical protein
LLNDFCKVCNASLAPDVFVSYELSWTANKNVKDKNVGILQQKKDTSVGKCLDYYSMWQLSNKYTIMFVHTTYTEMLATQRGCHNTCTANSPLFGFCWRSPRDQNMLVSRRG